jgi:hypothetical protein
MDSLQAAGSESVSKHSKPAAYGSVEMGVAVALKGPGFGFKVVEETCWNEGAWGADGGQRFLTLSGDDVSATLRFMMPPKDSSAPTEFFLVAFGIDSGGAWCDLQVNLAPTKTGALIHRNYCDPDKDENVAKRHHQKKVTHRSDKGKNITVTVDDDSNTVVVSS